jgi:hypothetical protein
MYLDDATRALIEEILRRSCTQISCPNSALWLAEADHLLPIVGYGPHASNFIGEYRHPLSEGIISMVHASGQPFCENNISANPQHSSRLYLQPYIQTEANKSQQVLAFNHNDLAETEFSSILIGRILDSME